MLATLLESRAPEQSRGGGAAFSVAAHVALVGLVAATAVPRRHTAIADPSAPIIHFHLAVPPAREAGHVDAASSAPNTLSLTAPPITIAPVVTFGTQLPTIAIASGSTSDGLGLGAPTGVGRGPSGILDGGDAHDAAPRGRDLLMWVVTTAKPRYPESLREAEVEGSVVVQFSVDTTGRVDLASVQVRSSTHPLFTRAVLEALPNFRFKPAEEGGHRVVATGEMPFEFSLVGAKRD